MLLLGCEAPTGSAHAQPSATAVAKAAEAAPKQKPKEIPLADRLHSPLEEDRPVADKLRSPRETLKTLYFAVLTYDLFPRMIEDATACLDLDALQPRPAPEDAAMLALDLEYILQSVALPLSSVPDQGTGERIVLHDTDEFKLSLRRGSDGGWRFDAETLEGLPAMRRAAQERRPKRSADRSALREGFTDPRATLRQFISDTARNDFYAAAAALDLSSLSNEQRRREGPALAQQLAFVMQHRGFLFRQEVPQQLDGPSYTWHIDKNGRIALERLRQPDGKDAWLFTRQTVRNIPRMYAAAQSTKPDERYVRLGLIIPPLQGQGKAAVQKRPEDVPAHLGSPRALLQGFFRTMDGADANDAKLADALEYLNLDNLPPADRAALGGKLAFRLDAVLRRLPIDLHAVPDDWSAPPHVLGEAQGVRVEIVRQRDGCWCFSQATIDRVPEMFDKLPAKTRPEQEHGMLLDSARDTLVTFQSAARRRQFTQAACCLNLNEIPASARDELGPVLAFKLQYVLERIGRIYIQEVPDKPEGPRHVLYRGELGRIVLDRRVDEPNKGQWQFTPETVKNVEAMFRAVLGRSPEGGPEEGVELLAVPRFWETPGVWLRLRIPDWLQVSVGPLDIYQWLGVFLAIAASWLGARLMMTVVTRLAAWLLHRCGSVLSSSFVARALRPLTALTAAWTFFWLLEGLDLSLAIGSTVFAAEKFLITALFGWLGLRLMDLSMAVYTNTERLRPHRSLGDMIVPVSMRLGKAVVLLVVATYMIYQIGEIDLLGRFLTGLGVAGLAASLSAQDALKNYFGTLLLIGERAFKIGDRINVGGKEGVVEQVGFRSTRLRTADDSLLTIPNAVIAASAIDNMGVRVYRRFSITVAMSPDTPLRRLLELRDRLQSWLGDQRLVVRDKVEARIQQVADLGVGLSLSLFLDSGDPADETCFRESVSGEILRLAEALGVEIVPSDRQSLLKNADPSFRTDEGERTQSAA
ncbi:MAG TPA: mechanosensitive ion channel domain-containing protein [Gemmataceae bacterium]